MSPRPTRTTLATVAAIASLVSLTALAALGHARPNRYGHSDRVERHMLPAVSTGPRDPAWRPDGRAIAVAMRGDVWVLPAEGGGGTAVALTAGPAYHFEPAWSPDGRRVALTMDLGGNLDVGVVSAEGGPVERVTTGAQVDVQPAWSRDGRSLYYVSARGGDFQIRRRDLDTGVDTMVVARGIQPAVSPDGRQLAYVAEVQGRLGSGGLWVRPLPDGEPRLVHYEETEYRMRPQWTPDGQSLLFVSDERGSNDVMIVPAAGGNPTRLTIDERDELAPSPSPDGTRVAFTSNRAGASALYVASIAGGPPAAWREVAVRARTPRVASGRVRVRVTAADGNPVPARVSVDGSDGRAYAPDGGFHRVAPVTETHYFHAAGEVEVEVPAGRTVVEAVHGFEYRPARVTLDVPAGSVRTATLRLARLADFPARGWFSGDTHLHDLHQGEQGLTHAAFVDQLRAEDLHVTNALIHMDGTRLMGRWGDLTGAPHPLSTGEHLLQYAEEFRGSLGHVSLLGVRRYVLPLTAGVRGTAYAQPELDAVYVDSARAQGGIAGFGHPYLARPTTPAVAASTLIAVDVALGRGDFYDVAALYSDELGSAELYYRLLNCGFRIAATGGTDNFSDVGRDPPPGSDRTYVRLRAGEPLTVARWLDGIRAQHTFATTGPLLSLDVAGRGPGDEIALGDAAPPALAVRAEAVSIAPMERLEILVNGRVVETVRATDSSRVAFAGAVAVPRGGWVAARVLGPASRYVGDDYAFAHTSPVYVVRGGRRFTAAEDARFLAQTVDAVRERVARAPWRTAAERERFMAALDRARAVYQKIADESAP
jgi:TolB protein